MSNECQECGKLNDRLHSYLVCQPCLNKLNHKWIAVGERLPEVFSGNHWADNHKVLAYTRWGETLAATYGKVSDDLDLDPYWYRMDGVNLDADDVTHWMELPEGPGE